MFLAPSVQSTIVKKFNVTNTVFLCCDIATACVTVMTHPQTLQLCTSR